MERQPLQGLRVAVLVTDGFEQIELAEPMGALLDAGASPAIIAPKAGQVRGWNHTDWGEGFRVDRALAEASPADYHALLLPGGVLSPDQLRIDEAAVAFVRAMCLADKPVAAICHGPWTLINAGAVAGRRMTSYPSVRVDLENAGALWADEAVVVDGGMVTSRNPGDLPAFCRELVRVFGEAHRAQAAGQVSTAPNNSFEEGTGVEAIGEDPAALAGNWLGNSAYPEGNTVRQDPGT